MVSSIESIAAKLPPLPNLAPSALYSATLSFPSLPTPPLLLLSLFVVPKSSIINSLYTLSEPASLGFQPEAD